MASFTTFLKEKVWYIAFLLAVAYFVFLIRSDLVQNDRLAREKSAMAKGLENEQARQTALKQRMKMLNDPSFTEKLAREKLGVIKRGETSYKVIVQ